MAIVHKNKNIMSKCLKELINFFIENYTEIINQKNHHRPQERTFALVLYLWLDCDLTRMDKASTFKNIN